ncbi:MAG: DivIVA domain-containing protein [Bacteroidota bacterium]
MKLTPLDIRKQEFRKALRGYDPVEVDTFMEMVANEYEALLKEAKGSTEKVIELETQLADYRQIEKSLQQTLLQAQEATGKTYEAARRESDVILREAELRAAQITEQANAELARLRNEIVRLRGRQGSMLARLRVLLSSELDLLRMLELEQRPVVSPGAEEEEAARDILTGLDNDGTA